MGNTKGVINAKTEQSIRKAQEYSEKPEELKKILEEVQITYTDEGKKTSFFQDEKEERLVIRVTLIRGSQSFWLDFGRSIRDTDIYRRAKCQFTQKEIDYSGTMLMLKEKGEAQREWQEVLDDTLYSLLCCIKSDYGCPIVFKEFCGEYGYDTDSRKAHDLWERCLEQSAGLERIFTEEEIQAFPQ
jgi:hypothetical protein